MSRPCPWPRSPWRPRSARRRVPQARRSRGPRSRTRYESASAVPRSRPSRGGYNGGSWAGLTRPLNSRQLVEPATGQNYGVEDSSIRTPLSPTRTEEAPIHGKVVVIAGATSGIGPIAATRLAALGARIVLVARDRGRADATLTGLRQAGPNLAHSAPIADLPILPDMNRVR